MNMADAYTAMIVLLTAQDAWHDAGYAVTKTRAFRVMPLPNMNADQQYIMRQKRQGYLFTQADVDTARAMLKLNSFELREMFKKNPA